MSHVLVFGATGFLGEQVIRALRRDERVESVTTVGRDRCDLVEASVDDLHLIISEMAPDAIVNCTGRLDGTNLELMLANAAVTAKLIDALPDTGIRYIRLGSAGEYGPVAQGHAVRETDPVNPISAYGLSHLCATRLVEFAADAGRVDGVTLRVFNPIGPGMREGNVLGRATAQLRSAIATNAPAITLGPLGAYRDFVDSRDVACAVVAAVFAPKLSRRVLNVGSASAVQVREAVAQLAALAGYHGEIHEQGSPSHRSATVDWMLADITQTGDALGWRPTYELVDSLKGIWAGLDGTGEA